MADNFNGYILAIFVCMSLCLCLNACGFQPVYGTSNNSSNVNVVKQFETVDIAQIPNREGQILRNTLIDRLHGSNQNSEKTYRLVVSEINEIILNTIKMIEIQSKNI